MKRTRRVETARYNTVAPNGRPVTVIEITLQIEFTSYDSGTQRLSGTRSYATSDGKPVNWLSETAFELVTSGETLTRV